VVTCEGGITTLSCNPLPSQNPRSSGMSPLGLVTLNRKNHSIMVTLGGIGSYYTSLTFKPQAFYPCYKLCDNKVFNRFQEFKALVENQKGRKFKILQSDNGVQYTSTKFADFCTEQGIRRQLTVPYNPQQNGIAERKNMAIVGAARSMLHDQALPFYLWAKACNIAVYLQNRSPHRALGRKTPEEAFNESRPDIKHLRIFRCSTFSRVPLEKRTKLDPTIERGMLVGYSKVSKAYKIYIPTLRRVVVRRDVRFEEDRAFRRSLESRNRVEEVPQLQSDASQGTQPQVSSTPSSGVTGPPGTGSTSQLLSIQTVGTGASGS
jgi:hypothetical protein